jgi:hypothetical protein
LSRGVIARSVGASKYREETMRIAVLVAAAIAFTTPSAFAQTKNLSSDTLKKATCDCRKMNKKNEKRFAQCMWRRLGYEVQASTVAGIACPDPKAKKK